MRIIVDAFKLMAFWKKKFLIKVTPKNHIRKFEILEISQWNQFHSAIFPFNRLMWYTFVILLIPSEKSRVSNFLT